MTPIRTRSARRALTLIELLVVILIIAALLVVAVPSVSSILYSSEAAMAETQLYAAMRAGRDAALRAPNRDDTAVVFSYSPAPDGGRLVMTPCVRVSADFYDIPASLAAGPTLREIFVPVAAVEPVQLPRHWMVRGYAPANSIEPPPTGIWYEGGNRYGQTPNRGDWVFPETGFYVSSSPTTATEGRFRHTFMVRFIAGVGVIATQSGMPALVFMPDARTPQDFDTLLPPAEVAELKTLRLANPRRYVERVVASTSITAAAKRRLLSSDSPDMVTVKPVSALALYDETRLAAALRARLDPDTGCLYKAHIINEFPTFVPVATAGGGMTDVDAQSGIVINQWIEGDTDLTDGIERRQDGDEPEARIFTVGRYNGVLKLVETQK